jgi:hypothetical protein
MTSFRSRATAKTCKFGKNDVAKALTPAKN